MAVYLKIFLIVFLLSSCTSGKNEHDHLLFDFFMEENEFPIALTLPQYVSWLEDTSHHVMAYVENDSFRLSIMYRPVAVETALSVIECNEKFETVLNENPEYHIFVISCLDKRGQSKLKQACGLDFIKQLSERVFVIRNDKDTIEPIKEIVPSMIVNSPGYIYVLMPKGKPIYTYKTCIFYPQLGNKEVIAVKIDSTILANLPYLKL